MMSSLNSSLSEDRGGILSDDLTEENVVRITRAFIRYVHIASTSSPSLKIAVGFDGRKRSRDFASLAAEIISKSGIEVLLSSDVVPVPALSFATRHFRCMGGVMLTGGSTPPDGVGIEFKGGDGAPLSTEEIVKIGLLLSEFTRSPVDLSNASPSEISTVEFLTDYKSYLKTIIDLPALTTFAQNPKNNAGVIIDSMGGAGQTIIEEILGSCGWRAQTLFSVPEIRFFDRCPKPIPENLQALRYNVTVVDAQMGVATDGDAGTCGIILDNGDWLDIQSMTMALLWHLLEQKKWAGNFLKPPFITDRVRRFSDFGGMSVIETNLEGGPRSLPKADWMLGVSEKGEISFGSHLPERDGILAGLLFAEMAAVSGKPCRQIVKLIEDKWGKGFYRSVDLQFPPPDPWYRLSRLRSAAPSIHPEENLASQQIFERAGLVQGTKLQWGFCRWLFAELIAKESAIRIHAEALTREELDSTLGRVVEILKS